MATSSRKESRIFFRSKEQNAGTRNTFAFFEGRSIISDFPSTQYLKEADAGKLGSGELGTKSEVQALHTPISFKASKLSEIAYLLGYVTGKTDNVYSVGSAVYRHEFEPLGVASRTLPTFSFEYGNQAATACDSFIHTIMNDFSISLTAGGTGIIDATFNGFANLHYSNSGTLTRNATVNNSSFVGSYEFKGEPYINFKAAKLYYGTLEATPLVVDDISMTSHDMSSATEITSYLESITFTLSNGITADSLIRAGGSGVLNNQDRGERAATLELTLRKSENFDAKVLANTQTALQLVIPGPVIASTYRWSAVFVWPVVQFGNVSQDAGSPILETIPCEVMEDSSRMGFYAFFQNGVDQGMNTQIATSKSSSSSSSSQSASSSSSSSSS